MVLTSTVCLYPFNFICVGVVGRQGEAGAMVLIRKTYLAYLSTFYSLYHPPLNVSLMRACILCASFTIIFSVHQAMPGA